MGKESDEYRMSAPFEEDRMPIPSFGRFQTVAEISFISHLFPIIAGRKVKVSALSTKLKSWGTF